MPHTPAPREIRRRRVCAGLSSLVAIALATAVFLAANALSFRLWARWSFTPEAALSDAAIEALERVPGRLELVAAFERGHPLRDAVRGLLAACVDAARAAPWLELVVESVDINHDPAAAAALLRRESMPANSLLVRTANRSAVLDEFDLAGNMTGSADHQTADPTGECEKALVSAIMSLMRPADATVGFLVGRGEYDPEDENPVTGASLSARELEKAGWRVRTFSLADGARVPAWCDVLVDAGPRVMFTPREAEALSSWLAGGGRALLLFDDPYASGLSPTLLSWGLRLEPPPKASSRILSTPTTGWSDHPAVRRLAGTASWWADPCTVASDSPDAVPLLFVGGPAPSAAQTPAAFGQRCVAMAATGELAPDSRRSPRLVVAGDSDILSNGRFGSGGSGNARLVLSLVDWLGAPDAPPRATITAPDDAPSGDSPAGVTSSAVQPQTGAPILTLCAIWPIAILAFGFFVWIPLSKL